MLGLFRKKPEVIKAWEGLINWEVLRRNPVDLNTVNNYLTRTNRTITQFIDELFTDLPSIRIWLDNQAANIFKFTSKQIDDFVSFSTKQSSQSKVMLGKYDNGGQQGTLPKQEIIIPILIWVINGMKQKSSNRWN